jgi:hypothetical protein
MLSAPAAKPSKRRLLRKAETLPSQRRQALVFLFACHISA